MISGTVPVKQRAKLLKLLNSATQIHVESAQAIARKAAHGDVESFMRKVVLAMHELERDVVVERLQAGLDAKKKASPFKTQDGHVKVNGRKTT